MNDAHQNGPSRGAGDARERALSSPADDEDDEEENSRLYAKLQGAAATHDTSSARGVADENDSDIIDSDEPMGSWLP